MSEVVNYVEGTMALLQPSSAAIVVSKGEEVLFEAYLQGSSEGLPEVRIDRDSLFYLASCTKTFSSGVLMRMVEKGVVGLDDPVSKYLPEFSESGLGDYSREAVRVLHLASHTSGLEYPEGESKGSFDDLTVATQPGEVFKYSSIGMAVLQKVLEVAGGKPYAELMQDEILSPLGLNNTRYVFEFDSSLPLVPTKAHDVSDFEDHFSFIQEGHLLGSGLYSTALDVNRYAQLWALSGRLDGKSYFSSDKVRKAASTFGVSDFNGAEYGILWWVFPEKGALVMSGATHSVSAIIPESQVVVTVMRNYFGPIPEGFVFHEDKEAIVDLAAKIGESR
ncbi:MAG: beta-lactamase family protein [Opitutales bacterium]|nr:beta-lactamase family protein [Opitutales bacterium]